MIKTKNTAIKQIEIRKPHPEDWDKKIFDEELALKLVSYVGNHIVHVPKAYKTPKVCLEAVKHNAMLSFIPEDLRTKEVCDIAIKRRKAYGEDIPRKLLLNDYNMCKRLVKLNGLNLRFIPLKNKTEEICKAAVKNRGSSFRYVPRKYWTLDLFETALKDMWFGHEERSNCNLYYTEVIRQIKRNKKLRETD